jgi:hypothetical protein
MAWEMRGVNGPYYTRSVRREGRVVREYLGSGLAAELLSVVQKEQREMQAIERRVEQREQAESAAIEAMLGNLSAGLDAFTRAVLEAVGYHRPQRGRWRKRRMGKPKSAALAKQNEPELDPRFEEQITAFRKAEDGDRAALAAVTELADRDFPEVWDSYGNVASQARERLIELVAGGNAVTVEALRRKVAVVRDQALGPNPSPLETLLATRVALCWLQCYYEDGKDTAALKQGLAWVSVLNQQKRAERAQKRYLAAIKALAQVRKLQIPTIQVNVGAQQVNVANLHGADLPGAFSAGR